jgi:hypothetical protein
VGGLGYALFGTSRQLAVGPTSAIAMLVGTIDPLEGSLLILPGSGLVALGLFLGKAERRLLRDWLWVFGLIAIGVAALFALSAIGGIGGKSGHSMWLGVLILPYPVGWIMALVSAIFEFIGFLKAKIRGAQA